MKWMSIHEMGGRMSCDLWALTMYDICKRWFMELKLWGWYEFDMRHERGWYQCGMIMIWDGVPYSRFENNELVWFGWEYARGEFWETVCDVYVYMCVCVCWICLID